MVTLTATARCLRCDWTAPPDEANLKAMCQRCHLAYDGPHHAQTRTAARARDLAATMDTLPGLEAAP